MTGDAMVWLHRTVERPEAEARLVCFPHAGGSASFFRDWGGNLPGIEVFAVCYPGRAERIAEEPPTDLIQLGADIADAVVSLGDDRPVSLFGHSLGAVVALETARRLEELGRGPARLFASGSRDAPLPDAAEYEDQSPESVAQRLVELGGTDAELVADPYFQELVLPYIVSDGAMFHAYPNPMEPVLQCPVTTIFGDEDVDADRRPWRELTSSALDEHVVPGDHFYLTPNPPYALLQRQLAAASNPAGAE
ncbi:thioesterase II family protein [Amycolatopsis sp. NPDC059021]|uniref:thioesterase II family protein n=1 Tax=Amycolatopsis sp. NPDC059021 TaxID=3346704 RepID=UPI00366C4D3F